MSKTKLAVICWKNSLMGTSGNGQAIPYNLAVVAAEKANKEYPHIFHWVELIGEVDKEDKGDRND